MVTRRLLLPLLVLLLSTTVANAVAAASDNADENENENDDLVSPIVNREIQVSVQSPWPSSPWNVFCEAHAFLRNHAFLDKLASATAANKDMDVSSYAQATELAVQWAEEIGIHNPLLKLALTLRAQSPTCEMHRGLAMEFLPTSTTNNNDEHSVDAFAVVNGQVYTDLATFPETFASTKGDDDHDSSLLLLPKEVPKGEGTLVILYANLGTSAFSAWYQRLTKSTSNGYAVVVRHLGSPTTDDKTTSLQGYGVRLDIRNVEYKVFDERTVTDEEQAAAMVNVSALSTLAPHFLAGVNVTELQKELLSSKRDYLYDAQSLQAELWKRHQAQQQHTQLIPPAWQRRQLGLQAATVIAAPKTASNINKHDELMLLQEVSQNLPSVASTLVHVEVPESILKVSEAMEDVLHSLISQSGGGLFINGKPLVVERGSFNVFEMIQRLSEEQEWLDRLQAKIQPFLNDDDSTSSSMAALEELQAAWMMGEDFFVSLADQEEEEEQKGGGANSAARKYIRINVEDGEKGAVMYVNDIEKDAAYQSWPTRLEQGLMAMQYGMPPSVRRNLFTMLVVENPLDTATVQNTMGRNMAMQLMQGQYPVRLAVLIVDEKDLEECEQWVRDTRPKEGEPCPFKGDSWLDRKTTPSLSDLKTIPATPRDIHRMYAYIDSQYVENREILQAYQDYIAGKLDRTPPSNGEFLSLYDIFTIHGKLVVGLRILQEPPTPVDVAQSLLSMDKDDMRFEYFQGLRFAVDKGLKSGMDFLNGRPLPKGNNEETSEAVGILFMEEQKAIFGMIMGREITDTSPRNVYRKILSKKAKNVFPKIHPLFTTSGDDAYLDLNHEFGSDSLLIPKTMEGRNPLEQDAVFVVEAVLELDTDFGMQLAKSIVNAMENVATNVNDTPIAVAYRVLPSTELAAKTPMCTVFSSASSVDKTVLWEALEKEKYPATFKQGCISLAYLKNGLPSKNFVVANGRYFNLEDIKTIDAADFELLMSIHLERTRPVTKLLKKYVESNNVHEAVSRATAFLSASEVTSAGRLNPLEQILSIEKQVGVDENPLRFSWNSDCDNKRLKMSVLAVVDPITESAQRLSPLLQILRDELQLPLTVILAPTIDVESDSKIPISSYYRFVADSNAYQGDGQHSPLAHFSNLPTDHVLTVRMDVPEPWDIQQTHTVQDTDNLRCSFQSGCSDEAAVGSITPGVDLWNHRQLTKIEYGLEHLLFAGQCYETNAGPPNGLQLTLSKHSYGRKSTDAAAAATMEIGPDGTVKSTDDGTSLNKKDGDSHYSDTLVMKTVGYWQLRANPGVWDLNMLKGSRGAEIFDVMDGDVKGGAVQVHGKNTNNNTQQMIMGDFVGQKRSVLLVQRKKGYEKANLFDETQVATTDEDVVHVFSLATGHLYERLLKIMMLSVTKRTSSKVKFWLFENYLSPTFKASARAMAEKIGCEVEFVTYKWPEWLR